MSAPREEFEALVARQVGNPAVQEELLTLYAAASERAEQLEEEVNAEMRKTIKAHAEVAALKAKYDKAISEQRILFDANAHNFAMWMKDKAELQAAIVKAISERQLLELDGEAIGEARVYLKEHLGAACECAFFDDCIHNAVALCLQARAERDAARAALSTIRGFDDPWSHRGHEPSEVGHECRMCRIMQTVHKALAGEPVREV